RQCVFQSPQYRDQRDRCRPRRPGPEDPFWAPSYADPLVRWAESRSYEYECVACSGPMVPLSVKTTNTRIEGRQVSRFHPGNPFSAITRSIVTVATTSRP